MGIASSRTGRRQEAAPDRDLHCWPSSIGIGLAVALLAGLAFWFGSALWNGLHATHYADLAQLTQAGQLVWHAHLRAVYATVPTDALPLSFLVMAPLAPVLDRLPDPIYFHNPATVIAGSYILLVGGIPLLHAVRRLAWETGVRSRLWILQVGAALLVLLPEYEYGHLEDALALTCTLYAVRRLLRGDRLYAALLLGVATGFKQWAVMLMPFVVMSAPRHRRLRTALVGAVVPASLLAAAFGIDGRFGVHTLVLPVASNVWSGHPGLETVLFGTSAAEVSRILAVAVAVVLGWTLRSVREPTRVLLACSAILVVRPLTELVDYSYYWSPALLLLTVAGASAARRVRPALLVLPVAGLLWSAPEGRGSSAGGWWACQLLILVVAVVLQIRDMASSRRALPSAPAPAPAAG